MLSSPWSSEEETLGLLSLVLVEQVDVLWVLWLVWFVFFFIYTEDVEKMWGEKLFHSTYDSVGNNWFFYLGYVKVTSSEGEMFTFHSVGNLSGMAYLIVKLGLWRHAVRFTEASDPESVLIKPFHMICLMHILSSI